ncbi:MAG TPA: ATP-binding protein [Myxococcales bacterium]|jgi:signal transduction histidine kinase/DNA-binding response OmpR family regulator
MISREQRAVPDALSGGGEMGALMRTIDWSATPVGPVESWPQSLRTALSILLETGFPMYIAWGAGFTQFYNDGYRPILGSTKHPAAMGISTRETFAEIWHIIGPMFEGVMQGRPVTVTDFLLPLDRHGFTEECYFVFSYSPIREESGQVGGVLVTVTETTERVLGARRLKTLQALSAETQQARTQNDACRSAAEVLARNPDDVPWSLIYLSHDEGKSARLAARSAPATLELPLELDLHGKSEAAPELFSMLPGKCLQLPILRPGESRAAGILVVAVSPRLRLDARYRSFLELLASQIATAIGSARSLEEAKARADALAEIDRAKTAFFSNVSHEFRTPLTLLLGPARDALSAAQTLPPEDIQRWELVQRNAQRLLKLVNTLLDFSRIEAGRVEAAYEPADLARLTSDLASLFRSAIESAGLRLRLDLRPLGEPVYVDRDMWEKIVLNLLSNALKFTFEGEIVVGLRERDGAAELTVKDTGTGIAPDQLPLIFDRFHRVHGARSRTHEGTGIGLALVQELVTLHAGAVSVESALGRGTTFTVRLPLGAAHLPKDRIGARRPEVSTALGAAPFVDEALRWNDPEAPLPAPGEAAASKSEERILAVDDNADMREYLERILSTRWQVQTAPDGRAALEAIRADPPQLILADVMMPKLDGFGLVAALKADPRTAAIPVVLVSARAGEEASAEGRRAGADDYLVKPFSAKELVARVESQLALGKLREADRRHRDELKRLFNGAPVFICLLRGPQHVFELANEAYQRLVGRDVTGKTVREALPDVEGQGFFELLDRVYSTGEPYIGNEVPIVLTGSQGTPAKEVYATFTYEPFRRLDGTIDGIAVFGFDVTEIVVTRARAEALAEQAMRSDRRKDEFLAMLGHELRNPLAPIVTALKLMELRGDSTGRREREVIERQVGHLSRLVDDLLDVARIAQGKIELSKRPVELAEVAAKAVEMASPLFEMKAHRLELNLPRGLFVDGDAVRLSQVIGNLLTNAARYTPDGGHVRLSAARDGDEVVVRVRDDGIGIAADFLPRIFDLFAQGPRSIDRSEGGLGLGLALVQNLVALHGGTVSAKSEGLGRGSEFEVRLRGLRETARVASPREDSVAAARRGRKVLVVDDNVDAAEMLAEALQMVGHDVAVAHDGPQALAVQERFHAEIGVLDLGLPVMDGYELAARLRKMTAAPAQLIALTGYGQDEDRRRTAMAGFDAHLVKPIDLDRLTALIAGLA